MVITMGELIDPIEVQIMSGEIRGVPLETGESYNTDGSVEFYWAKPPRDTHRFGGSTAEWVRETLSEREIYRWACETFGPAQTPGHKIKRKWIQFDRSYCFREESDRMLFILKWGGKN